MSAQLKESKDFQKSECGKEDKESKFNRCVACCLAENSCLSIIIQCF